MSPRVRRCLACPTFIPVIESYCDRCRSAKNKAKNSASYYQTPEWRRLRKSVANECVYCGSRDRVAAHHLTGRREGGPDSAENLVALCQVHHSEYEADKRANRSTELTRYVESIRPNQEGLWEQ